MKTKEPIKVINEAVFNEHEVDTALKFIAGRWQGDVEIDGKTYTGEHGKYDYIDYGFELR